MLDPVDIPVAVIFVGALAESSEQVASFESNGAAE
jgi:hypothetical protein